MYTGSQEIDADERRRKQPNTGIMARGDDSIKTDFHFDFKHGLKLDLKFYLEMDLTFDLKSDLKMELLKIQPLVPRSTVISDD